MTSIVPSDIGFENRGPESCHCHTDNADTPEQDKDGRSGYLSSGTEAEDEEEDRCRRSR